MKLDINVTILKEFTHTVMRIAHDWTMQGDREDGLTALEAIEEFRDERATELFLRMMEGDNWIEVFYDWRMIDRETLGSLKKRTLLNALLDADLDEEETIDVVSAYLKGDEGGDDEDES